MTPFVLSLDGRSTRKISRLDNSKLKALVYDILPLRRKVLESDASGSRFGLAVRGRLVSGRTSVRYRFGSPFSSKVMVCGHGLVTLSLTINETSNWLSSLPILMQVILVVTV